MQEADEEEHIQHKLKEAQYYRPIYDHGGLSNSGGSGLQTIQSDLPEQL